MSCGQPFRDNPKYESTSLRQTFLPCGRKSDLFGHIVAKSRKAWQTLELFPTWISEVHQTYPGHRKSIWACRECLGHLICQKKKAKICIFGWVISRISFRLQTDYKLIRPQITKVDWLRWLTTSWLTNYKLTDYWLQVDWICWMQVDWLQVDMLIDYKLTEYADWLQVDWLQVGWLQVDLTAKFDFKLEMTFKWL